MEETSSVTDASDGNESEIRAEVSKDEPDAVGPLLQKIQELELENAELKRKLVVKRFGLNRFSYDNSMISFYTGFSSFKILEVFFGYIQPAANSMTRKYYVPVNPLSLHGNRQRSLLLIDEFFLFCCRIKLGLLEEDLADRFNITVPTVSRHIISWANFLYFVLGSIPIWPTRDQIIANMPTAFKAMYPNVRCIIDCTEVFTAKASSLVLNSQMYSNYKSHSTLKGLIGIAPHGVITFVSRLYTGSISDVAIVKDSGFLELIDQGDSVMADKGFTIGKILAEKGATLNTPAFLSGKSQFNPDEIQENQKIAAVRVHVERAIRRIKVFRIFATPLPLSLIGTCNQIWTVACLLTNFRGPLIKCAMANNENENN